MNKQKAQNDKIFYLLLSPIIPLIKVPKKLQKSAIHLILDRSAAKSDLMYIPDCVFVYIKLF